VNKRQYAQKCVEVVVSEASRRDARSTSDSGQLEAELSRLVAEYDALKLEQMQIEHKLLELKNEVRGRMLDPQRYRELCDEQQLGAYRITEMRPRLTFLKSEIHKMKDAIKDSRATIGTENDEASLQGIFDKLRLIAKELKAIRNHLGIADK
jgi:hypothetical protein